MEQELQVILVNDRDEPQGVMEKMEAHHKAILHRAFSVFIFNSQGKMLLQQRADNKYHSAGLWTNTCCSHPLPGELTRQAAIRRLQEEMGFSTALRKIFDFIYRSEFDNGLVEHEFDHVFAGIYDGPVTPNPMEVKNYAYQEMGWIKEELKRQPARFTIWFHIAFPRVEQWVRENGGIPKLMLNLKN